MRSLVWLLGLAACGGGNSKPPIVDAGACWPLDATPGGMVTMGSGDSAYQPMGTTLEITADGSQADPFIAIQSRITGMPPGDPTDALNPKNPKTKIAAVIPDLGKTLGVPCPASLGYVPSPDATDSFDMIHGLRLGFGTPAEAQQAVGHQAMITVEVVGSNGLYAMDQRTIMITGAIGNGLDAGVTDAN